MSICSRRRSRALTLFVLGLFVVAVAGCGDQDAPDDTAQDAPADPEVEEPADTGGEEPDGTGEPDPAAEAEDAEDGGELTEVRFRYAWLPIAQDAPMLAALEFGWFEEEGLAVETTVGSGSNDSVTTTGAGEFDIAISAAPAVLTGIEQDIPIVTVGMILQSSPAGFAMLPDSGIETPKDFEGHKVGIAPESVVYQYWLALVDREGLDMSTITEVPVGPSPEPLLTGQIDAYPYFPTDQRTLAIEAEIGEPPNIFFFSEYGVDSLDQAIIANTSFSEENPEAVSGFLRAYKRGMEWTQENLAEAVDLVDVTYEDVTPEAAEFELEQIFELWSNDVTDQHCLLYQDDDAWAETADLLIETEFIVGDVDYTEAYTNDYLLDAGC